MSVSDRLNEIEAREQAATPGEWQVIADGNEPVVCLAIGGYEVAYFGEGETGSEKANAVFIAAARSDVPWLIGRVRELTEALRRLASPDEMGGMGVTETMTGPAAVELRCRMNYASAVLAASSEEGLDG